MPCHPYGHGTRLRQIVKIFLPNRPVKMALKWLTPTKQYNFEVVSSAANIEEARINRRHVWQFAK